MSLVTQFTSQPSVAFLEELLRVRVKSYPELSRGLPQEREKTGYTTTPGPINVILKREASLFLLSLPIDTKAMSPQEASSCWPQVQPVGPAPHEAGVRS